jgi:hypothetical protein
VRTTANRLWVDVTLDGRTTSYRLYRGAFSR